MENFENILKYNFLKCKIVAKTYLNNFWTKSENTSLKNAKRLKCIYNSLLVKDLLSFSCKYIKQNTILIVYT